MNFTVLIPARLASTRLPNKPLADIGGKPMIVRVAERAEQSGAAQVVVAADSPANVWAVGGSTGPTPEETITRVFHNGGSGWREVPFPLGNSKSIMQVTGLTSVAGGASRRA